MKPFKTVYNLHPPAVKSSSQQEHFESQARLHRGARCVHTLRLRAAQVHRCTGAQVADGRDRPDHFMSRPALCGHRGPQQDSGESIHSFKSICTGRTRDLIPSCHAIIIIIIMIMTTQQRFSIAL